MDYSQLIKEFNDPKEIARDKGLAKLGDEIINMAYSMAKSLYIGNCDGEKVNKKVLMLAMKNSGLRSLAKLRAKSHDIADSAEAIIAYSVLDGIVENNEIIELLFSELVKVGPNMYVPSEKHEADTMILTVLLSKIKKLLYEKMQYIG